MKKYLRFLSAFCAIVLGCSYCLAADSAGKEGFALSGKVEGGVRVIEVEASRYKYEPNPIVVKLGEKIRIIATSIDVTHGFAISEFKVDAVVKPGEPASIEFTAAKEGEFRIFCTVFCGPGHVNMQGKLIVVK